MKKAAIFLIPTLSLVLVGCTNNKQNNNLVQKQPNITNVYKKTIKDKEQNIENKLKKITEQNNKFQVFEDTQYSVKSLLNSISFSNNKININKYKDINYVGLDQYLNLLKDIIEINSKSKNVFYNNVSYTLTKELKKETNNNITTITLINKYSLKDKNKNSDFTLSEFVKFDYLTQQITISSVNFYNLLNPYEDETNLEYKYSKTLDKNPLIIDLNKYNIYIFNKNNQLYLPLLVLNQVFLTESETQIYFNNKDLFVFEVFDLYDHRNNETKTKLSSNKQDTELSNDLKEFSYNYLWFLLDNFYPLKQENKNYKDYLEKYKKELMSNKLNHFKATNLLIRDLNDIHTKVLLQSPLYDLKTKNEDLLVKESIRTDRVGNFRKYERELIRESGDLMEKDIRYTKDNKTAIIKINIISRDTIAGVKKQLEEIKNKNTFKNVIFDLTLNRGGSLPSTFILLGYLTNQSFKYHKFYPNTNNKEILDIKSKIGKFDFKYYILTSPINYSAGNVFAAVSKTNKIAKIIGYQSAGGASEVRLNVLPNGMIIRKSSMYTLTDNNWNSYEFGTQPDIEFDKSKGYDFKKLFDLDYIQNIVNKN
ncbi:S41 family peptidase [Mycoplasma mycoides subsp. mycoides]|uniref:Peptidase S41 family protein n=1 Tax=Mycoplasma mycoides subsp. mycoides TaxID=2103 RepID=A0AAE2JT09_MYCMY|nr:S41 family peptidase [Mycoplasma mycoides]KJQ45751.1 peptidase S41 family protein [Mycoplasma mycoides subsp. mycoides]KJQ47338.1 peptidase S41 family protein [Mycoplasma mycoides subsp. mycoides]PTD33369.1 putative lipoprotein and peptidase [Mycoplasma mycoides subsp. mycoides KH3J]PTD33723.1 putative lipoprotein and peptidase [Mycoplasma mycoides subsp. mycoides str. Gemu Goffa]